jgi:N-acylneuraminate cytidylyltransferase
MIALIGLRSGSKRIENKNIQDFCGKPLCYWVIKKANECKKIDKVYILTDSEDYKRIVESFKFKKVKVFIEKTIKEDGNVNLPYQFIIDFPEIQFDNLCLLQAPCPFVDIDGAVSNFFIEGKDSQLSVVRLKRFFWYDYGYPKNYKIYERPRTQEIEGELIEIGDCYITTKKNLIKNRNFLGGNIGLFEEPEYCMFEIDNEIEWAIMESINEKLGLLNG